MWDASWIPVTVSMPGDFQQVASRRDDEHSGGKVEDSRHVGKLGLFGIADADVGEYLARGVCVAAQVDKRARPGACCHNSQICRDGGGIGELDTGDFVFAIAIGDGEQAGDAAVAKVHTARLVEQLFGIAH